MCKQHHVAAVVEDHFINIWEWREKKIKRIGINLEILTTGSIESKQWIYHHRCKDGKCDKREKKMENKRCKATRNCSTENYVVAGVYFLFFTVNGVSFSRILCVSLFRDLVKSNSQAYGWCWILSSITANDSKVR